MLFNDTENEKRIEKRRRRSIFVLLLITLIIIAVPLAAIAWFGGVNDEYYILKARRAIEKGDYRKAVDCALQCPKYNDTAKVLAEAVKRGAANGASAEQKNSLGTSDLERAVVFVNSGGFSKGAVDTVETAVVDVGEAAFGRGEFDYAEDVFTIVTLNGTALKAKAAAFKDAVSGVKALERGEYAKAEELLRDADAYPAVKPYYQAACRGLVLTGARDGDLEPVKEHVRTLKTVKIDEEISAEILSASLRARESGDVALAMGFLDLLPTGSYDEGLRPQLEYEQGVQYYDAGDYYNAERSFLRAAGIDGADEMYNKSRYARALDLSQNGQYYMAIQIFEELGDYEDAAERVIECNYLLSAEFVDVTYIKLEGLGDDVNVHFGTDGISTKKDTVLKNYDSAIEFFEQHPGYRDSDELLREVYYKKAGIIAEENPEAALALYNKIPDYRDVAEITAADGRLMRVLSVRSGDTLTFGSYYINHDAELEPITWRVLDVSEGCALLISDRALAFSEYFSPEDEEKYAPDDNALNHYRSSLMYPSRADVYKSYYHFGRSTASRYLNGEFSDTAFTAEEKACITNRTGTDVFVLNRYQAEKYFDGENALRCRLTPYAMRIGKKAGAPEASVSGNANWLLDEVIVNNFGLEGVCYVSGTGQISETGMAPAYGKYTVFALRPCVWVDVEKLTALGKGE